MGRMNFNFFFFIYKGSLHIYLLIATAGKFDSSHKGILEEIPEHVNREKGSCK
jgi:hypothetical protein